MISKASSPRQPRGHGGCMTCKIRKVKCDETRPKCLRCKGTGRNCDGYGAIQSLSLQILSNPEELRCYHYFWKQVLPVLPGHYDHPFWGTWIRQTCFSEVAIQHAMVAVGALHESITSKFARKSSAATRQQLFSVQQYNKAIHRLTSNNAYALPIELILTTCIIFIMYENLSGRNSKALKHLKSGITMLKLWTPTTSSQSIAKEEYLVPIYTRGYVRQPVIKIKRAFDSLEGARKHLQIILDQIYSSINLAFLSGNENALSATVSHGKLLLQEWHGNRFARTEGPMDHERRREEILLNLQFETASILLTAVLLEDECEFDNYIDIFQTIINQCELLIASESTLLANDLAKMDTFVYGFDLNILPSLNITALKCRHPTLRRKAIKLLSTGNRYEGLWSGKTIARIAQKTLEIEETGCLNPTTCTDIPRKNRLRLTSISYNTALSGSMSRNGTHPSLGHAHYILEWSRNNYNNEAAEIFKAVLPVSADEISDSWGPGKIQWRMGFQYNSQSAQWKTSNSSSSTKRNCAEGSNNLPITARCKLCQNNHQSESLEMAPSKHGPTKEVESPGTGNSNQHINLFWDHWRLRKMPLQQNHAMHVEIEKEAARGGRSYRDAQATNSSEDLPSHLLISIP